MNRSQIVELSWEQVQFLWQYGNKNFFRLYDDGSVAYVELDDWNNIQKHYDCGGKFGIEETKVFRMEVRIRNRSIGEQKIYVQKLEMPSSVDLLEKCKEFGMHGEMEVSIVSTTINDYYADSLEYGIYVNDDFSRIYVEE